MGNRRRSKGDGAVYQRKSDGLFVGMLDLGLVDGKRRRKTVYGKTEREVRRKLRDMQRGREQGLDLLAPSRTLSEWLDAWLSEVKGHDGTRSATVTLYRGLADRYIKPVIGSVRLDKLTPAHVQHLIAQTRVANTSREKPLSASTLRHVHKMLRNALNDAYRMELVTRNVAAQVKAPPVDQEKRPEMGIEDARSVLQAIRGDRLEAFFGLALTTGLRRGELLGLRWQDVDLEAGELRVRRALQRVDGSLRFVQPKTASSQRGVVLPKLALEYLHAHRKWQTAERFRLGDAWQDHDLVFCTSLGTAIEPRNVSRRWDQLRKAAGLEQFRLHDLRHGCATFMLAAGVPARVIMEVLGHSAIGVTLNTYTHVLPQVRQEAADAIDRALGP